MKKHILNLILCLALVLSLSVSAAAESLNTTNVKVGDGTVEIGMEEDNVLVSLDESGKTAQIAIPVPSDYDAGAAYYVEKDGFLVVAVNPAVKDGFMRFPVPGAGKYEIKQGTPPTLDELLSNPPQNGVVSSLPVDVLKENHTVAGELVLVANGSIKGEGGTRTLTVGENGTLTIWNLNGRVAVELGAGDTISFDTNGNAIITAAENKHGDTPVGYGSFILSGLDDEYTRKYFLLKAGEVPGETQDESVTVKADGTVAFDGEFAPVCYKENEEEPTHPFYGAVYLSQHASGHTLGTSGTLISECNGLYNHYTVIELVLEGAEAKSLVLATKVGMKDVVTASGIKVELGSTKLTLDSSYLNTLPAGLHTLKFHYDDGAAVELPLKIQQAATGTTTQTAAKADPTNPKTGDPMMGILLIMMGSAIGLTAVCAGKRKIR